jgi:hypothetical protein
MPFLVDVVVPAEVNLGEEFSLSFKMKNRTSSMEKINMLVMLSEFYLLSGSTSTVLEVSRAKTERFCIVNNVSWFDSQVAAGHTETMSLRAIALTAGRLPLPRVILHWEARGGHPVKVLDMGDKDVDRQSIYVKPCNA